MPAVNRLSAETGLPLVATNDAHYLRRDDARAHEILLCIQTGKTMSDPSRMRLEHARFLSEIARRDDAAFRRTGRFARPHLGDRAALPRRIWKRSRSRFPKFEVPAEHSTDTYFEFVARQGFERRRPRLEALRAAGRLKHDLPEYAERLDREIQMIQKMQFSGYFLIVWDFIRFARSKSIPVGPGRGSAAGSLVGYAMGITDIDPLQYGLLFERFLNPGAHQHARYRYRFLHEPARRSDSVRH